MALSAPPSTMILGPATARVSAERPRGRMRDDGEDVDEDGDFAAAFPRTVAADGSDDAEDATTCIMIRFVTHTHRVTPRRPRAPETGVLRPSVVRFI